MELASLLYYFDKAGEQKKRIETPDRIAIEKPKLQKREGQVIFQAPRLPIA